METEEDVDDPMDIDETVKESQIIEKSDDGKAIENGNPLDIVVLDDDEDDTSKSPNKSNSKVNGLIVDEFIDLVPESIGGICINYSCKSGRETMDAPAFCLSYYRVKSSTKMTKKVCLECYKIAVEMYDNLVSELKSGKLLFDVDVPLLNDMVEIEDSDEDEKEENKTVEYLDEYNFKFIEQNIDDVLNGVMQKFNLKEQVRKEETSLKHRYIKSNEECTKLSYNLKAMRKKVDDIQINFYKAFKPEIKEASMSIMIMDDYMFSSSTLVSKVPSDEPLRYPLPSGRKSVRKVKPVSYAETEDTNNSNSPKPVAPVLLLNNVKKENQPELIPDIEQPMDLPPPGPVVRPPLEINEIYYISRDGNTSGCWIRARLNNVVLSGAIYEGQKYTTTAYKLIELKQQKERIVEGKSIAYISCSSTRLRVGDRVIAVFKEISMGEIKKRSNPYYPGIVAEPPYEANKFRYLIFFDIGYSQYVPHNMVNLVYEVSHKVWEDMPPDCRPFIKKHIESQDWPMVKLKKDQSIITEYNGKWMLCTVINVDCSLVQVYFDELNRFEWIYRGSRRIKEIYREEQAATNRTSGQRASRKGQIESKNIVQYTPNVNFAQTETVEEERTEEPNQPSVRAVARKSTAKPQGQSVPTTVPFLPPVTSFNATGPTSKIMYFTPRDQYTMKRPYRSHDCSSKCKDFLTHNFSKLRGQNPLSKPLLCGWARMTVKVRGRKDIAYKAPCGRLLRNIAEVHYYLSTTKSEMTVDLFDFNHMVRCLAEFSVDCEPDPKDLSKGLEQVPIPVINGINNEMLDFCNYSTKRVPMEGVKMNLDPNYLVCCDCEDDCIDKTKCACWKLTLEGAEFFESSIEPNSVGYIYRRLQDQVVTGIYECNPRCKCTSTCLNRVAQNPMSLKLQVFRTHNRGWGIRCLNDVPQGSFICVYAGTIHTDQRANEDGKTYGDEYFAELDYIESVEKFKDDFEQEVDLDDEDRASEKAPPSPPDEEMEIDPQPMHRNSTGKKRYQDDNDFVPPVPLSSSRMESRIQTRLRRRRPRETDGEDDTDQDEPRTPTPNATPAPKATPHSPLKTSVEIKKELQEMSIAERLSKLSTEIDTVTISDDEDEVREVLSFNPKNASELEEKSKYGSVREQYGVDESIYIMDAKNAGNIGRFLNHSCAPNVFVQNVFVDTHDPRFPWVAFFSSQFIRAGTELTWNYSYDVGSVPGKVLYCNCAALECKGRLL